jgi:hypothetical protein
MPTNLKNKREVTSYQLFLLLQVQMLVKNMLRDLDFKRPQVAA